MTSKISLGLQRITRFLQRIDSPHERLDVIHVAGTNGKGSVSAMIANTLSRAGYKTGLFTSPHLAYRWDGISIDGHTIPRSAFLSLEKDLKIEEQMLLSTLPENNKSQLTTFEMMTAAAFVAFRREQVDIAVVEVGLGGGEDATNVISPLISVITSIGIDHTSFLGHDIKSITQAKGGIIKKGVPVVVSSDQEYDQVFGVLGTIQRTVDSGRKITWTPPNSTLDFRISNQNTARTVLQSIRDLHLKNGSLMDPELLTDEFIEKGLRTTTWKGRFERLDLSVLGGPGDALLDGAHNAQSLDALAKVLGPPEMSKPRVFIFALTSGKDPVALATLLSPGDNFIAVEFEAVDGMSWISPLSSGEILSRLSESCPASIKGVDFGSDVSGAIEAATVMLPGSQLIICGSLYLVGQVHRLLESGLYERSFAMSQTNESGTMGVYDPTMLESRVENYWRSLPPKTSVSHSNEASPLRFLLPPPNVTGALHIGHALTIAIQDSWCRYYAGQGHQVSWVPGIDHAGIATQSVVSKALAKAGTDYNTLSRDEFVEEIWKWRGDYGERITHQIRRLGTLLDWNEEYFTMDHLRSTAVIEAFRKLWDAGLIKRERRMVNWSTILQSVISDIEVDTKSIEGPTVIEGAEFGVMWRIRFYLVEGQEADLEKRWIEVDTTRPETIFGDRALAVNPEDPRYIQYIGKAVQHPLLPDVVLRIVADPEVSRDFGTGCVKLTPAHDASDYLMSQRHDSISVLPVYGRDGKILPLKDFPELTGMDRLAARKVVVALLKGREALVSTRSHKTTLHICSRSGCVIEPILLPQWFIHMEPLAQDVLAKDDISMSVQTRRDWKRWLKNTQDWCVSRQLVWGHRIPLYRIVDPASTKECWVFGADEDEARANAEGQEVIQDEDVLDTWFSSGILPLSAFGWPLVPFSREHKLQFIESGPDILFFWLARMAMLCTFLTGISPFREIIMHPLIRDSQGRKMSKSLGNVIDPMSIIEGQSLSSMISVLEASNLSTKEIQTSRADVKLNYPEGIAPAGSDALRFALVQSTIQSEALKFDLRSVMGGQYLCNKLWNCVRFYRFHASNGGASLPVLSNTRKRPTNTVMDSWLIYRFNESLEAFHQGFTQRHLSASTESLRSFFVDTFCDIYLEFIKTELRALHGQAERAERLLLFRHVLGNLLTLFGPFIPYISEDLWHLLGHRSSLHSQSLPSAIDVSQCPPMAEIDDNVDSLLTIIRALRCIDQRKSIDFTLHSTMDGTVECDILKYYANHIKSLTGAKTVTVTQDEVLKHRRAIPISSSVFISYETMDASDSPIAESRYLPSRHRNLAKLEKLENMVAQETYQSKVPEEVKAKHLAQIEILRAQIAMASE